MKNHFVGSTFGRPIKKFLSLALSLAMLCTMFTAFSVSVSANGGNIIHISDPADFTTDFSKTFTEDTTVVIDNDLTFTTGLRFSAKTGITVTVQSANDTNPATITSTGWIGTGCNDSNYNGKVVIKNLNIDIKDQWNFSIYNGANITMENVKITSKIPSEYLGSYQGHCVVGIFNWYNDNSATMPISVTMNNCVLDPGTVNAPTDGIDIITDNVTLAMNNCEIKGGMNSATDNEHFGTGNGIDIVAGLANTNVVLNNTTLHGGSSIRELSGGDGIRVHSGNVVLNNCTTYAGETVGCAITIENGNVTVNGGSVFAGSTATSGNNQIRKWNDQSKGTVTINPTFTVEGNTMTLSPAIEGIPLLLNGTQTLTTDAKGQITKTGDFTINDVITIPDAFQLNKSFLANCEVLSYRMPSQNSQITATADIPAPTYTVTIPETVSFGEQKQALAKYKTADVDQYGNKINVSIPFTISAQNVNNLFDDLGKLPQIDVAVSFDGTLKNGTDAIPYTVKNADSNAFTSGNVFCSFKNSSELKDGETNIANGTVWINRTDITKTADYTGTMTFTISIPDQK